MIIVNTSIRFTSSMTETVHNILRQAEKVYLKLPGCKWLQNYMKNVVYSKLPALLTPTAT